MINEVRFYSKTGNTKKIADAVAKAAGCEALSVNKPLTRNVDTLFIGAAVYRMGVDESVLKFIDSLTPKRVKRVVVFSTSGLFKKRAYKVIKRALKLKSIKVEKDFFFCKGQLAGMNVGRPNEKDIQDAYEFTSKILRGSHGR